MCQALGIRENAEFWGTEWFSTSLGYWIQRGECWEIRPLRCWAPHMEGVSATWGFTHFLWATGSHCQEGSLRLLYNDHAWRLLSVDYVLDIVLSAFHAASYWTFTTNPNVQIICHHPCSINEKNDAFKKLTEGHSVDKRLSQDQPVRVWRHTHSAVWPPRRLD